jgi:hypothetical protein
VIGDSHLSFGAKQFGAKQREADARQSVEDGFAAGGSESGFAIQSPPLVSYLRAQHA